MAVIVVLHVFSKVPVLGSGRYTRQAMFPSLTTASRIDEFCLEDDNDNDDCKDDHDDDARDNYDNDFEDNGIYDACRDDCKNEDANDHDDNDGDDTAVSPGTGRLQTARRAPGHPDDAAAGLPRTARTDPAVLQAAAQRAAVGRAHAGPEHGQGRLHPLAHAQAEASPARPLLQAPGPHGSQDDQRGDLHPPRPAAARAGQAARAAHGPGQV